MGASGYMNTSNQYVKYWIEIIDNWKDISNNITNVTVKVWAKRMNTGYKTWGSGSVTLRVDGVYHNSGTKQIEITSSSQVYHSWTGNITHNADGTKKLTCSAAINIPTVLSSSEQSYSENLTTIPRTSSFTINKSTCELGTPFTVNISRASSSFTHAVSYVIGSEKRYIQNWNNANISPSCTLPISDAVYMPSSTSLGINITVETYSGSTLIGSMSKVLTITCPTNIIPSFSRVVAQKVANGDDAVSCLVQGYSRIKATIEGAAGVYGSYISRHYYTINNTGYNSTSNVQDSGVITTAGDIAVQAEVVDSRGRGSGVKSTTIRVEPYEKPSLTGVVVRRVNDNHVYDTEGTLIHVRAKKQYSSLNDENTCEMSVWWRERGGSWSADTVLSDNEDFYFNNNRFTTDKEYEVCIRVRDKLNTVDTYYNIPTGEVTLDFIKGGRGMAVGKVCNKTDTFDVGWEAEFEKQVTFIKDVFLNGSLRHNGSYDDGKYYYNYTQGYFIKTNIRKNANTMFDLHITGNSYDIRRPVDIRINGYVYKNDIIERSCLVNSYNTDIYAFFTSDEYLGFWFRQVSGFNAFKFSLGTFNDQKPLYEVFDAPKPSGITNEYLLDKIISYTTQHSFIVDMGGNYNNNHVRFDNGLQICWGHTYEFIDFPHTYGSLKYSNTKISIAFSAPFSEQPRGSLVMHSSLGGFCTIDGKSATALSGYIYNAVEVSAWVACEYVMVGRWK